MCTMQKNVNVTKKIHVKNRQGERQKKKEGNDQIIQVQTEVGQNSIWKNKSKYIELGRNGKGVQTRKVVEKMTGIGIMSVI